MRQSLERMSSSRDQAIVRRVSSAMAVSMLKRLGYRWEALAERCGKTPKLPFPTNH
jgi:hypothetical protein